MTESRKGFSVPWNRFAISPKAGSLMLLCAYQSRSRIELPKKTIDTLVYLATHLFIVLSPALSAQQQSQPKPLRFDFTPFAGYRTSMSFLTEPSVFGTSPRLVLDASPSYGASFGVLLPEDGEVEVRWARQDSYIHSEDITPQVPRQRLILDQFHGDFSHEYSIEDWGQRAKPFVMLSVGATRVSSTTMASFTRFSFGVGGGIRFYASRHFGFKVQGEWVPVLVDPQVAFICGGGCIVHVGSTLGSQGEILAGPILRF